MTRTKTTILMLAIALMLVTAIVFGLTVGRTAFAIGETYVDASLDFEGVSLAGQVLGAPRYSVHSSVWVGDLTTWRQAPDGLTTRLLYVAQGDTIDDAVLSAPTTVGTYTVLLQVTGTGGEQYSLTDGTAVVAGTILTSMTYRVVSDNVNIITGPAADISYDGNSHYTNDVIGATRVYRNGVLVEDKSLYDVVVKRGGAVDTEVREIGTYTITVTGKADTVLEGESHTATFRVVQAAVDVIRLTSDYIYAGKYTTPGYEAQRAAYYRLTFDKNTALATESGTLDPTYAEAIYMQNDLVLPQPPTQPGNYVCRVRVKASPAGYTLQAGDCVDLPYTIRPIPYSPVYTNEDARQGERYSANTYSVSAIGEGTPFVLNVSGFVFTADADRGIDMHTSSVGYERYNYDSHTWSAVDSITSHGLYRADFTIDYGTGLTGKDYFGTADASYLVDETNCHIIYEFQVIGRYEVQGISRRYMATALALDALKPQIKYNGVTAPSDVVTFSYTHDGSAIELSAIKDNYDVGDYVGYARFTAAWPETGSVAQANDVYRFTFSIATTRYATADVVEVAAAADAIAATKTVYESYGIAEGSIGKYSYYSLQNGIAYHIGDDADQSQLCVGQGYYRVDAHVSGGKYDGSVFCVTVYVPSQGRQSDIVFDIPGLTGDSAPYCGNLFAASVQYEGEVDYTLYYQKQLIMDNNVETWILCDYPVDVGTYRAVMRFDCNNVYYDAAYADVLYRRFSITTRTLGATATIVGDGIFDGTAKAVSYGFTVDSKPVDTAMVKRFIGYDGDDFVQVFYADFGTSTTLYVPSDGTVPADAGTYGVGLLLVKDKGDYSCFGLDNAPVAVVTEVQLRNNPVTYFLRAGSVRVSRLQLDVVVTVPIGLDALYTGSSILPTYAYYKGNEGKSDVEAQYELTTWVRTNGLVEYVLKRKMPNSLVVETVADARDAGIYTHQLNVLESYKSNIYFGRIVTGDLSSSPDVSVSIVSGDSSRMTVTYRIRPLPLNVSYTALSNAFEQSGAFYQAYFGEVYRVADVNSLYFYTVDVDTGDPKDVSADFRSKVQMSVYNRRTGTVQRLGAVGEAAYTVLDEQQIFVAGSYTLGLVFDAPEGEEEIALYDRYSLTDGIDLTETGTLQAGCGFDVMFDVLAAQDMRVVFDPLFDSYTYDGNVKRFDIRFMCDQTDCTDALTLGTDYSISYYKYNSNSVPVPAEADDLIGENGITTRYKITLTFARNLYAYRCAQYKGKGVYTGNAAYVSKSSTVVFEFSITHAGELAWGWSVDGATFASSSALEGMIRTYYTGSTIDLAVRFAKASVYSGGAIAVNMDRGTDYDIWYYEKVFDDDHELVRCTRLPTAPTAPGEYVAEVVFIHNMSDFRHWTGTLYEPIYSYVNAETASGYGRSLMNHTTEDEYNTLNNEGRFLTLTILRPTLTFDGLSASSKVFDGTDSAVVSRIRSDAYTTTADTAVVPSLVAPVVQMLTGTTHSGHFATAAVSSDIPVTYWMTVGSLSLQLPHKSLLSVGQTGVNYLMQQIAVLEAASSANEAVLADVKAKLEAFALYYDFVLLDVKAAITRATVTILAQDFTRTYDPDFNDEGVLTYTLSAADLALLHSLTVEDIAVDAAANAYFVGSLVREDRLNASINADGYRILLGEGFAFKGNKLTLIDVREVGGTVESGLSDNIDITINDARYRITAKEITLDAALAVTDSHNNVTYTDITRLYNEEDPAITYYVSHGKLLFMDEVVYVDDQGRTGNGCDLSGQRQHSGLDMDPVGSYNVLYDNVRIYRHGQDVSDNYVIHTTPRVFTIKPLNLIITPAFDASYYFDNDLKPTETGVSILRHVVDSEYGLTTDTYDTLDLQQAFGASLEATYRMEEVATTDPTVDKTYKVSLGLVRVVKQDKTDISSNFTFTLSEKVQNVIISKYQINLVVADSVENNTVIKRFGQEDPHIALSFRDRRDANKYIIGEGSVPSRVEGEDAGTYAYLPDNMGSIVIYNQNNVDITSHCYVQVYEADQQTKKLSELKLEIQPLPVVVTVRSETVYKTGRAILPQIIYLGEDGNIISSSISSKIKAKFAVEDIMEQLNSENEAEEIEVKPYRVDQTADDNFTFTFAAGKLYIIYPNNVLTVETVADETETAQTNRFSFVNGVLFKTVQMYSVSTLDNGKQTRTMTISLPITDAIIEEDVYLICVHYDGSYVIRDGNYKDGQLLVSDNEFKYVLAAQPVYWPYYVLALLVVLIVVGIVSIVLYRRHREKIRGKKERPVRAKKPKKGKPAQTQSEDAADAADSSAPQTAATDLEDTDFSEDAEQEVTTDVVTADTDADVTQDTDASATDSADQSAHDDEAAETEGNGKKDRKEGKGKKDKKGKNAAEDAAPAAQAKKGKKAKQNAAPAFVPGASTVTPVANATVTPAVDNTDTIVTSTPNLTSNTTPNVTPSSVNTIPGLPDDDGDDIVINTVTRRVSDDD